MSSNDFPPDASPQALDRLARRRAGAKLGWIIHACVYILVNLLLMALSANSGRHWAVFPAWGWGLGLALHGAAVYFAAGRTAVFERMVQSERERITRDENQRP